MLINLLAHCVTEGNAMLIMFFVLWTISFLILIIDFKCESNRWVALTLFFLGTGPAANLFKSNLLPIIAEKIPKFTNDALILNGIIYTLSSFFPPYTLLIYAMSYSGILRFKNTATKILTKIILFIPVVLMYILVPVVPPVPRFQTNFVFLSVWAALYALLSYILIIKAYLREENKILRLERFVNIIFVIPGYTILLISGTVLPIYKNYDNKPLYMGLVIYLLATFSFFALKYSFFGVRITIEKQKSIYEKRLFNSGISIFNHSIKNEISKISFCANYLKETANLKDKNSEETLDIISSSSSHLLDMMKKLNFQAQEIVLNYQYIKLKDIVDDIIFSNKIFLEEKRITLSQKTDKDISIYCDKTHIKELISNLIKNAIEAIKDEGNIQILTSYEKKYLVIKIKDSGCGILEKDIGNITEPFFSTKKSSKNFGLGLYYCKKVIEKHGGFLEIKSQEGKGSEVSVFFPK